MKINAKIRRRESGKDILSIRFRAFAALIGIYVFSVGLAPVVERYACDGGRLKWLPSVPGAMAALEIYEWPARLISNLPFASLPFELSANFWYAVTNPPDTTP